MQASDANGEVFYTRSAIALLLTCLSPTFYHVYSQNSGVALVKTSTKNHARNTIATTIRHPESPEARYAFRVWTFQTDHSSRSFFSSIAHNPQYVHKILLHVCKMIRVMYKATTLGQVDGLSPHPLI